MKCFHICHIKLSFFFFLVFLLGKKKKFRNSGPCPLPIVKALIWRETQTEVTVSMQLWKKNVFVLWGKTRVTGIEFLLTQVIVTLPVLGVLTAFHQFIFPNTGINIPIP